MKFEGKNIVVTSNEPWGDIWYSKQNYAFELSRKNNVFFANPPSKWKVSNLFSTRFKKTKIYDSLHVISYQNRIPSAIPLLSLVNNFIVSRLLRKYLKSQGCTDFIFWAFDPIRLYNPKLLRADVSIYHCVDYFYFKYIGEKQLCLHSDYLFATSQLFLDEYKQFDKPKFIVPHGISKDEFDVDIDKLKEIDIPYKKYGLYIGVIDKRMDFEFYEEIIKKFSDTTFLFVGPLRLTENESAIRIFQDRKYSNVVIAGPKHFKELKYYVANAAFCTSFMDINFHANTVHHHKTLVYLAQGKPVFSFAFEEYKKDADIMYVSNEKGWLIEQVDKFIREGELPNLEDLRIQYAKQYTFENILKTAETYIN